jgi:hypothetical protein
VRRIRRRDQHRRPALGDRPEAGVADVRDRHAWPVKVRAPQRRDADPPGLRRRLPDARHLRENGRFGAAVAERHVLPPRRVLRAELVEVVDEHQPHAGRRAGLDEVGHRPRPDLAPDLAVIGKAHRQDDLRRPFDNAAHCCRIEDVASGELRSGRQVRGAAALRDAHRVAARQQGVGDGASYSAEAEDDDR